MNCHAPSGCGPDGGLDAIQARNATSREQTASACHRALQHNMRDVSLPKRYTNGFKLSSCHHASFAGCCGMPRALCSRPTRNAMAGSYSCWRHESSGSVPHVLPASIMKSLGAVSLCFPRRRGINTALTHFGEFFGFHGLPPRACLGRDTSNTPGPTTTPACRTGPSRPHFWAVPFPRHSAAFLSHDRLFANFRQTRRRRRQGPRPHQ